MTIIDSIILGVVEGFTEFLPISSTGHLIIVSKFLDLSQNSVTKAYEVIIQLAAILAVIFNCKTRFTLKKKDLWFKIFLAFAPITIIGYAFAPQIKSLFSIQIVAIMFIVGGVVFLIVEKYFIQEEKQIKTIDHITTKQALIIGLFQTLALIPGTSRAGSTIIGTLLLGFSRKASAEFSFLLALPVMVAVTVYDFTKHYHEFSTSNFITLGVGFIVSFFVAYITMKLFIAFLERFTFVAFGVYRIVFGIALLIFL